MRQADLIVLAALGLILIALAVVFLTRYAPLLRPQASAPYAERLVVELPLPRLEGEVSVEEAILARRSVRSYRKEPLSLEELSQLLWAAQGITDVRHGFRAAPSAGATYPLVVYVAVGENGVRGLKPGVYRYDPYRHILVLVKEGDVRSELCRASLGQPWVREAPVVFVITANFSRTTRRYGERGVRYVYMEAGHAAQNMYLEAAALKLGMVVVGAFHDDEVREVIGAPEGHDPLYVIPLGKPAVEVKPPTREELERYYERNRLRGG